MRRLALAMRCAAPYAGGVPAQFETLRASELYCPRCRMSQPVRERLLLVLPHADMHEYRCAVCGESVGQREVRSAPVAAPPARLRLPRRRP